MDKQGRCRTCGHHKFAHLKNWALIDSYEERGCLVQVTNSWDECRCLGYVSEDNLEYLEWKYACNNSWK
jgi:hypothetical protein